MRPRSTLDGHYFTLNQTIRGAISQETPKPELVDVWLKSTIDTAQVLNACVAATLRLRRFDVRNISPAVRQPTTCHASTHAPHNRLAF